MKFSIVVVCLNAGEKLRETVESIWAQTCTDYEIIVKDGFSTDGSVERLEHNMPGGAADRLRIVREKDTGIYDAMNQAVGCCQGEYVLFLNCGDLFADKTVLEEIRDGITENSKKQRAEDQTALHIFYGDIAERLTGAKVSSNPHIDAFACYRNVPCHQCCFYDRRLFAERGYDTAYRVRADYEHFLWSFFVKKAVPVWLPVTVASYEGGGFSETRENRKISETEHREITARYLSKGQLLRFRLILLMTLAPLRRVMAQSKRMAGFYNRFKRLLYRGKGG